MQPQRHRGRVPADTLPIQKKPKSLYVEIIARGVCGENFVHPRVKPYLKQGKEHVKTKIRLGTAPQLLRKVWSTL